MRSRLASILLLALLAGCLAPDEDGGADAAPETAEVATAADLTDSVDVDLVDGAFDDTWTFDFTDGATGYFSVNLRTRMQGLIDPTACVSWTRTFPGGQTTGNSGDCAQGGGNLNVGLSGGELLAGDMQVFHWDGDDLVAGHYTVHVTAPMQANRLMVAVGIDNPPTDGGLPGPDA